MVCPDRSGVTVPGQAALVLPVVSDEADLAWPLLPGLVRGVPAASPSTVPTVTLARLASRAGEVDLRARQIAACADSDDGIR
jgi:hypothetical protein